MTKQKSFKRLVRLRMDKTGESYTTARRALLAAEPPDSPARSGSQNVSGSPEPPRLPCSDARILERTGRGWEEWFELLDSRGATGMPHRDIARQVSAELGIEPLAWATQAVTTGYELAKGIRAVGERSDGFTGSASRRIAAPVERVVASISDEAERARWAPTPKLRERSRNGVKTIRFDAVDDDTRVTVHLDVRGPAKTTVIVEHSRLPDADAREAAKTHWRTALSGLKSDLES